LSGSADVTSLVTILFGLTRDDVSGTVRVGPNTAAARVFFWGALASPLQVLAPPFLLPLFPYRSDKFFESSVPVAEQSLIGYGCGLAFACPIGKHSAVVSGFTW